MSGVCGAWSLDGGEAEIGPMLARLERRGPDGTKEWSDGPVALGHTLLATTPEALVEQMPLTDASTGCVITADVRLDNRQELIAALGLGAETRTIGDGELILRAYLHWGDQCPARLHGDFAFAIWDPREARLFCARDHMGMRQLNYCHVPGKLFVFATESEAVVAHPLVPKRINDARIADFLDDIEGVDFTSTFFKDVLRLPPAHVMIVDSNGVSLRRYWQLVAGPALKLNSDAAYEEALLTVLTEAVRCRLRSVGPVGSMLSGGLDSGSVTAIAARLCGSNGTGPLQTFSAIGPGSDECAESDAIRAALGVEGIDPTLIDHSALAPWLDELWRLELETGEPFEQHMALIRAVYISARQRGCKVMLDGVAGDVVFTVGNRVADHLRRGKFQSAWKEARGEQAFWKIPRYRFRSLLGGLWVAFVPNGIRSLRRRLMWKAADLSRPTDLRARRSLSRSHVSLNDLPEIDRRIEAISHPHLVAARERYDRTAAALGIEPRDPFMDVRLIQFCLSLPADQLQRDGFPKHILRRATEAMLPDKVRWRRGKEHLGWIFTQRLFGAFPDWRASLEASRPILARYARPSPECRLERPEEVEARYGLFVLANWLERNRP